MKTLASVLFGAGVLAVATMGAAQPASADVGVYVSPFGFGVSIESYRRYCGDPWYRHRYWGYCRRFYNNYDDEYGYFGDDYYGDYYRGGNFFFDDDRDFRFRRHHRDRDDWGGRWHHDRDDWRGHERHNWEGWGERGHREGRGGGEPEHHSGGWGEHERHDGGDRGGHGGEGGEHHERGRER